jgi:DNA-binding transcriptional LysR family regulator
LPVGVLVAAAARRHDQFVELADIEMFLTLSDELHFARTANRMGVSPARVSQRIRALEKNIGGGLFERTSRRVHLTPLGMDLSARLRPVYDDLRATISRAQVLACGGATTLRIGFTALAGGPPLHRLVRAFEADRPDHQVVLREIDLADPLEPLRTSTIDVLVTWWLGSTPGFDDGPVVDVQPRVLAVAADHPVAGRSAVSAEMIADYPVLAGATAYVPCPLPSGRTIRLSARDARTPGEAATQLARGTVVLPTLASFGTLVDQADIVLVPIRDLPPVRCRLLWRRMSGHDAGVRALADSVPATGRPEDVAGDRVRVGLRDVVHVRFADVRGADIKEMDTRVGGGRGR